MRRILAWLLVVLGALVFLPALAAALWVGTDDTATTGPHPSTTSGVAILTDPEVLRYVGPVLHLTVARTDGEPVFVGIAHEVDAASYLGESGRRVVSRVGLPWDVESSERSGAATAVAPPAGQPWWLESQEGAGSQTLVWPIPNGRYSIVALNADGSPGVDVQVTLGLEIEGTFYTLLAIATFGLLVVLIGLWLLLWRRRRAKRPVGLSEPVSTNTSGATAPAIMADTDSPGRVRTPDAYEPERPLPAETTRRSDPERAVPVETNVTYDPERPLPVDPTGPYDSQQPDAPAVFEAAPESPDPASVTRPGPAPYRPADQ